MYESPHRIADTLNGLLAASMSISSTPLSSRDATVRSTVAQEEAVLAGSKSGIETCPLPAAMEDLDEDLSASARQPAGESVREDRTASVVPCGDEGKERATATVAAASARCVREWMVLDFMCVYYLSPQVQQSLR